MASALGLASALSASPTGAGACAPERTAMNKTKKAGCPILRVLCEGADSTTAGCPILRVFCEGWDSTAGCPILRVLCEGACPEPAEGWDSTTACCVWEQRFSAAKRCFPVESALAPEVENIIPPPPLPPAP